ncbi:MAG: hypothetical protein KGN02_07670 [bacterium]|nr:hypothetical protein [bacterium]
MRLWRRSRSRLSEALDAVCGKDRARRDVLARSVGSPFIESDVAAALLGEDLWYPPLVEFRKYLETAVERPHLWDFPFSESGRWPSSTWRALSLHTRIARARIASPAHESDFVFAALAFGMRERELRTAFKELLAIGLCREICRGIYRVYAIAPLAALDHDLHLVRVIAHWLEMLAQADHVAEDRAPTGYEVHGYVEACTCCKKRWGIRPRAPDWVPPFHPGCRCFAQPRFASRIPPINMEESR